MLVFVKKQIPKILPKLISCVLILFMAGCGLEEEPPHETGSGESMQSSLSEKETAATGIEEYARIFEEIRAGNFSTVQGLDAKQMHELEHVYKQAAENDRLLWMECDLNGDGRDELLMMESFENGRESTITGIFMEKGGKCFRILWDVQDYTSCYYLVEGMVIQYSENHGLGTRYCYVKQEIDSEGKMIQTKRFEIIDISEDDDIALSFIERGFTEPGTYYVVTDYGEDGHTPEHEIKMGKEEWLLEFGREIGDYETVNLEDYGSGKMS